MTVAALIVGIGGWQTYTQPLIASLQKYEPNCKVVLIDNGSDPPYPPAHNVTLRRTERTCYAAAINEAQRLAGNVDWYLVLNNDVLCVGPFLHLLPNAPVLGGNTVRQVRGIQYVDAWLMLIHADVWRAVGAFDDGYVMASWEDVDYSYRAQLDGFSVVTTALPFQHLETRQRVTLPGFSGTHEVNSARFRAKWGR